ncbi:MAG: hypothetical protein U0736_19175 [Gemmataceae bacterium]
MKRSQRPAAAGDRPLWRRGGVIALVVLAAVGVAALVLHDPSEGRLAEQTQQLVGRWQRTDGEYVLEVQAVRGDGGVDAAYFNPQPIRVAEARADRDGGRVRLTVELRDEGYPGSSYTLRYDAADDRLVGTYHQLPAGQTFDVTFDRLPPE